jgi:hypothetical protein
MGACQTCGFPNPDDEELCRQCGLSLADPESTMEDAEHDAAREHALNSLSVREKYVFSRLDRKNFELPWSKNEEEAIAKYNYGFVDFYVGDDESCMEEDEDELDDFSDYLGYNVIDRIHSTGGIIGLFVSDEGEIQRCLDRLNRDGYKVHMMLPASQNVLGWLISLTILVITLLLYTRAPGYIVIGERISQLERPPDSAET